MSEGKADPQGREAERLRHRPDHDEVLELVDPRGTRARPVLDVGLVHHDDRLGVVARTLHDLLGLPPASERVARIADPAQLGVVTGVDDCGAVQPGSDRVQRVRRRLDRRPRAGAEERLRDEQDEIVGPRPDDDVLGREADVRGGRLAERPVGAVGVLLEPRHAPGERHLRHTGKRGRVLVELEDRLGPDPVAPGDVLDAGRPPVRGEPLPDPLRAQTSGAHDATAAAWSGRPSTRASGPTTAAARRTPSSDAVTICSGFKKASRPRPPVARARPPVGSTCVAPAA